MTAYGLHQDLCYFGEPERTKDIALAKTLGAKISRNTLIWKDVETSPGVFDWSGPDDIVKRLRHQGTTPLFWVGTWPSWLPGYRGQWMPPTEFDQAVLAYARFCALAAKRYKGKVSRFEIWNEQNEHNFWGTVSGIESWQALYEYALLYLGARGAIHSAAPGAQVAVGGLAGLQAGGEAFHSGLGWLDEFLKIVPPDSVQRVAIHPYTSNGQPPDVTHEFRDNFSAIQAVRDFLDSLGRTGVGIWVTEWGWRTEVVGEANQATYVKKSLEMIRDLYPFVELATYFSDRDKGGVQSGLYRQDYSARPAAAAYKDFLL